MKEQCFQYIQDSVMQGYHPTATDIERDVLQQGGNVASNVHKLLTQLKSEGRLTWTVVDGKRQFSFPQAVVKEVLDVKQLSREQLMNTLKCVSTELGIRDILENPALKITREEWEQTPPSVQEVVLDLHVNLY